MKLQIQNLSKTYKNGVAALQNVNLEIDKGLFGLLGPNGAGKSTLMRTIATLQEADTGTILFEGADISTNKNQLRRNLGYLPQEFGVYPGLGPETLLHHLAILKGITDKAERKDQIEDLLNRVNLWDARKKAVHSYSGGMKQRFGIAQALLGQPKLIIVDEPTAGLDPGERNRFYNLLSEIGEQVIVILSTHIVQDVQQLCAEMAIINKGKLIYQGKPNTSIEELNGLVWEKLITKNELADYDSSHEIISTRLVSGKPLIHVISNSNPGDGFRNITADLEDVFFTKVMDIENLVPILS